MWQFRKLISNEGIYMTVKGRVHKYQDNVDTDVIIPARYLTSADPAHLAAHCMEDIDPSFAGKVAPGDIIVAGKNFGCGSSREHAPVAIKASGISLVIASDFARIFYRNSINVGLPIMECSEAAEAIDNGDIVEADFDSGIITDITKGISFQAGSFPEFIKEIMAAGGLVEYTKGKMNNG